MKQWLLWLALNGYGSKDVEAMGEILWQDFCDECLDKEEE